VAALSAGETGFRKVLPTSPRTAIERLVAPAPFRGEDHFAEGELRLLDRNVQLALVACREAVARARDPFAEGGGHEAAAIIAAASAACRRSRRTTTGSTG